MDILKVFEIDTIIGRYLPNFIISNIITNFLKINSYVHII